MPPRVGFGGVEVRFPGDRGVGFGELFEFEVTVEEYLVVEHFFVELALEALLLPLEVLHPIHALR